MRRSLALVFAAIALAALIGDFVLYRVAKRFYLREAMVRLEPSGNPSFTETGPAASPRVLLLGDSRIAEWASPSPDRLHAFNAGVGGETTAQIGLRALEAIDHVNPAVVVIEAGINDLKAIPLMPDRQQQIEDRCVERLMELVKLGRERGASVILCSVWPAGKVEWARKPVWSGAVANSVQTVNRALKERCRGVAGVAFLDLTEDVPTDRDYIDTLHFNRAFYERISPRLEKSIGELTGK